MVRDEVAEQRGAEGGPNALRGHQVLVGDRETAERAHGLPARRRLIDRRGAREQVVRVEQRHDGVDRRVDALDLREVRRHDLSRRGLSRRDQADEVDCRPEAQLRGTAGPALPVSALVLVSFGGISAPIEASPQS